jgi:hypothetical protein
MAQDWLARDAQGQLQQPQAQAAPPTQGGWQQQGTQQGGWGQQSPAPAPQQGGWGAPAPAAPSPAPQAGGWGNPAPAAPSANPNPGVHPDLVEALRKKGVTLQPGQTQQDAESIWGYVANNPDVA